MSYATFYITCFNNIFKKNPSFSGYAFKVCNVHQSEMLAIVK